MIVARAWAKSLCTVDKYVGWIVPATIAGIRLCRRKDINIVIVTAPQFSAIIAGVFISMASGAKLVIDYRDEWTNYRSTYPKPFGKFVCTKIERFAVKRASGVVLCTDIMHADFIKAFDGLAPDAVEVIYNGFERSIAEPSSSAGDDRITMVYAGTFHGRRRLSVIAPALAELLAEGTISADSFRFKIYSRLRDIDYAVIEESGIGSVVQVCEPVPYDTILKVMRAADILFLPSGDEVPYAVPFKFFDYLSVGRPILAVASRSSTVGDLMHTVDCGEFAEFGNTPAIVRALKIFLQCDKTYSFAGAERFHWANAAGQYLNLLNRISKEIA